MSSVEGPKVFTISPNKNTKDGRPAPVAIAVKYPKVIKALSFPSANVRRIFEYGASNLELAFSAL
jgi:hypothetical protein